jgi:thymidine kinase
MVGHLELIIGPMFSGKSTELIRKIRLAKIINKKVLVIKPLIDSRYDPNKIVSHSFEAEACETVNFLKQLDAKIKDYDLIIIDEGQFFPDLKEYTLCWVDKYEKEIIIGGLDGDFKRNPIGQILDLIPHSNKCTKLSSLCKICNDGKEAIFTHRTVRQDSQEQVQIGGAESYMPLCRKHYLEHN